MRHSNSKHKISVLLGLKFVNLNHKLKMQPHGLMNVALDKLKL